MKQEKKFYQKWWFWVLCFFVVVMIGNAINRPKEIKTLKETIATLDYSDTVTALKVLDSIYKVRKSYIDDTDFGPMVKLVKAKMIELGKDPDYVAPKPQKAISAEKQLHDQMSAWDGSLPPLVEVVKDNMNDPKSFEHDKTLYRQTAADSLEFIMTMTFRGKNAFGGVVKNVASARYNARTKTLTDVEIH